jgi:phosphatidylserine decarboxylase
MGSLEMVVWDKDMLKKEYLGEVALPLEEWFKNGAVAFDDVNNLVSRCLCLTGGVIASTRC